MQQSKLIQFLKLFTTDEIKRFKLFLLSPYFNTSQKMVKFFGLLELHYPDFDSPKLDKEKIYKALHGAGKYNSNTMLELISDMLKLAKTFTQHEQIEKDEIEASQIRYAWLDERSGEKQREAEVDLVNKYLDKYDQHNIYYYKHRWLNDYHAMELSTLKLMGAEHKLLKDADISQPAHSLNRYYLINFFEVNNFSIALANIYNQNTTEPVYEHIEALASKYINKGDLSLDLFYYSFQLVRTDNEQYFFELKAKLLASDNMVYYAARQEAGVTLENYCVRKIREGIARFGKEVIDIFRYEVEQGLCLNHGKMNYIFYQNVAGLGAETEELDWVDYFVEAYKNHLPEEFREEAYCYSKAHVLFARKNFQDALRNALASATPHFFWTKILARNLTARAQYELGMFDQLYIELDTYRHHLKDEKVSPIRRHHTQVFVDGLRRMAELNFEPTSDGLKQLEQFIQTEPVPNRKWFLEKIAELAHRERK